MPTRHTRNPKANPEPGSASYQEVLDFGRAGRYLSLSRATHRPTYQGEFRMKRLAVLPLLILAGLALGVGAARGADNELSAAEKNEGYILLFNGKDLQGWHRTSAGFGGWHVADGALALSKGGGMLYTDAPYDNFVLKIDFKMSKGCNSGVFLRVGDPRDEVQTGLEIQVLDDSGRKPSRNS